MLHSKFTTCELLLLLLLLCVAIISELQINFDIGLYL